MARGGRRVVRRIEAVTNTRVVGDLRVGQEIYVPFGFGPLFPFDPAGKDYSFPKGLYYGKVIKQTLLDDGDLLSLVRLKRRYSGQTMWLFPEGQRVCDVRGWLGYFSNLRKQDVFICGKLEHGECVYEFNRGDIDWFDIDCVGMRLRTV